MCVFAFESLFTPVSLLVKSNCSSQLLPLTDALDSAQRKCHRATETSSLSTTESDCDRDARRKRCRVQFSDEEDCSTVASALRKTAKTTRPSCTTTTAATALDMPEELCMSFYENRIAPKCKFTNYSSDCMFCKYSN